MADEKEWNHRSFEGCRFWDDQLRMFRLGSDGRGYTIDAFGFEVELRGKGLQHMRWTWETFPGAREMMDDEPLAEWVQYGPCSYPGCEAEPKIYIASRPYCAEHGVNATTTSPKIAR